MEDNKIERLRREIKAIKELAKQKERETKQAEFLLRRRRR